MFIFWSCFNQCILGFVLGCFLLMMLFIIFSVAELEVEEFVINWSAELIQLGSRLYALWNRTAGDCLLDSILQVTWGVLDADNTLRRALADSLAEGAMV